MTSRFRRENMAKGGWRCWCACFFLEWTLACCPSHLVFFAVGEVKDCGETFMTCRICYVNINSKNTWRLWSSKSKVCSQVCCKSYLKIFAADSVCIQMTNYWDCLLPQQQPFSIHCFLSCIHRKKTMPCSEILLLSTLWSGLNYSHRRLWAAVLPCGSYGQWEGM